MQDYSISTDSTCFDLGLIHRFIASSYWGEGIPLETLKKAIENSLCFGVFSATGEQVGFARMVTDRATFAYMSDVFIVDAHRGLGLSKWLVEYMLTHPDLQGLRRMVLATKDAHGLYRQYGFTGLASPESYMEIWQPDVYLKQATKN